MSTNPTAEALYTIIWMFLAVLAVLWFLLPFAIFGTKDKLDALIAEVRRTNQLLEEKSEASEENPKDELLTESPQVAHRFGPSGERL